MNNFVFYSPTEFVFGKATEMQVGALARKHGARKVMIVYGGILFDGWRAAESGGYESV